MHVHWISSLTLVTLPGHDVVTLFKILMNSNIEFMTKKQRKKNVYICRGHPELRIS